MTEVTKQEVVPVGKKNRYRTVAIESVKVEQLAAELPPGRCIVAVDVAKEAMVAGFGGQDGVCKALVRFSHPRQTLAFVSLVEALRVQGFEVEAAMEPTGVYCEALRHQLEIRDIPVYRVDPTRSHAMTGVLDGVPSQHDAKSCTLIAFLHARSISARWESKTPVQRELRALVNEHGLYQRPFEQARGHLEAVVSEYFPELGQFISSPCAWHLHLLQAFPSPAAMAAAPDKVRALLHRVTRGRLTVERIGELLAAAKSSLGVPMLEAEAQRVSALAETMLYHRDRMKEVDRRIRKTVARIQGMDRLVELLGAVTVGIMIADLSNPADYKSADAFVKAYGLNLKEQSSGMHKGQVRITKRGPSRARRYLFLAALRLIRWDPIVRAWYQARRAYKAGLKIKAVIAVMRKLARAMVHVARGERFDARKLFDVRRLGPIPSAPVVEPNLDDDDDTPATGPSAGDWNTPSLTSL